MAPAALAAVLPSKLPPLTVSVPALKMAIAEIGFVAIKGSISNGLAMPPLLLALSGVPSL